MQRLLGHLARFSSFSTQGEVLCTQGLAFLLRNPAASKALMAYLQAGAGTAVSEEVTWLPEAIQRDGGRPDLEARTADGKPVAKIEAKLGAPLSDKQLQSYVTDLQDRAGGGVLLVLVPRHRISEATTLASQAFSLEGDGRFRRISNIPGSVVAVASWDDLLDELGAVSGEPFEGDFAQFRDLYRSLNGDFVEPAPAEGEWRQDVAIQYVALADRATRLLTSLVMPLGTDDKGEPGEYRRRYVCRSAGAAEKPSCFSIGVRAPFINHTTPIWLRFNSSTPKFVEIQRRLDASDLSRRIVGHQGHIWLPLELPPNETNGE
ncbi:MAG: hypothetical protein Q8L75_18495, partial [Acidobacteriota bacterium]|nr:hypothetical protein [Acidobacteriota bacterium]